MDVVALAQFGIDYAVATLGTATTRDHLERLFRHAPEVVFCFDGDRAGREAAWRALENAPAGAARGPAGEFPVPARGRGPGYAGAQGGQRTRFGARLKTATPLPDYFFQNLATRWTSTAWTGGPGWWNSPGRYLSKMRPGVLRQMMLARLGGAEPYGSLDKLPVPSGSGGRPAKLSASAARASCSGQGAARPWCARPSPCCSSIRNLPEQLAMRSELAGP